MFEEHKMKCYKHPAEEAVGNCSNCGRGLCKKCAETMVGKLCEKCIQIKAVSPKLHLYGLIAAFLGWLGATDSFMIGFYIFTTYLALPPVLRTEHLAYQAYAAIVLTAILVFALVYGSYLLWKEKAKKGGITNFVAATILIAIYIYFAFISRPSLLRWLGFIGGFLCTPAILSGTIGILMKKQKI